MNIFALGKLDDERRKVAVAVIISILLHLLVILLVAVALTFRLSPTLPPKEEKPIELTVLDQAAPKPLQQPDYVDTSEANRSEKAPEQPAFESDKNTKAASALAATGSAPVPTQEGEKSPALEFENHEYTPGKEPRPAAPAGAPPQPAQNAAPPVPPAPAATPVSTPEPENTPRPTSPLALLEPPKPQATPKLTPPPRPPTQAQQPTQATTQAQPSTPSAPGYQPQTRITRITGNISNNGSRSSVAAASTPLGKYKKQLSDAIGSLWYFNVNETMGLLSTGTVDVRFVVNQNGKVINLQIVRNSSNESFASCTASSIMEAEIPPIPKELLPMLEGGRIEIEFSFTILPN